jgi:hypothetical protein
MRACLLPLLLLAHFSASGAELRVSTDFEGGSARVESIDQGTRTIHFVPGGDPQRGWPCWWYLRIDGLPAGESAILDLGGSELPVRNNGEETGKPLAPAWAMPMRAAFSTDKIDWQQTDAGKRNGQRIEYEVTGAGGPVWVAWGPPFTPQDTQALLTAAEKALPAAASFELARTREGRPVRGLRLSASAEHQPPAIWIQARQHAWESGSSWVARGIAEWLTGKDADAIWLREHAEIFLIPIMDVDNVATGNGGKEANPHDHNRAWTDAPIYPEVAAAQRRLNLLAKQKRLAVFLELHNPSPGDMHPFFYCGPSELLSAEGNRNEARFLELARRFIAGPLSVDPEPRFTGPKYHPLWRQMAPQWVLAHGNPETVATCLETSWNTPSSTTEGYRTVGRQLGQTLSEYLRNR